MVDPFLILALGFDSGKISCAGIQASRQCSLINSSYLPVWLRAEYAEYTEYNRAFNVVML